MVCPMKTAWDLHKAWPEAEFVIVHDAGHSASVSISIRLESFSSPFIIKISMSISELCRKKALRQNW